MLLCCQVEMLIGILVWKVEVVHVCCLAGRSAVGLVSASSVDPTNFTSIRYVDILCRYCTRVVRKI